MPRAFTTFTTSLYDEENKDFCDLSAGATKMYLILSTQKEITACGSLPLTLKRWSKKIRESERHLMGEWLHELADGRFIFIDEDTEELLLRSFAKHDGGYKHGRRVLAVIASAEAIASPRLREAIAIELAKLNVFTAIPVPPDRDSIATNEASDRDSLGIEVPRESGRDVVTYVSTSGNHIPETFNHVPGTASHPDPGATTAQTLIAKWIDHVPKRPPQAVVGKTAKTVAALLAEGIDPTDVERGLAQWANRGLDPSVLPSVVNEVMNAQPSRRPSTTDQRTAVGLSVVAQLEAQGL